MNSRKTNQMSDSKLGSWGFLEILVKLIRYKSCSACQPFSGFTHVGIRIVGNNCFVESVKELPFQSGMVQGHHFLRLH